MAGDAESVASSHIAPSNRSAKRRKTEAEPHTTHEIREASPTTALEVDIMILDYLAQKTILKCLASRKGKRYATAMLQNNVLLSDDFVALFKQRHPSYKPDDALRRRLLVLQVTTLFTQRLTNNSTTPSHQSLALLRRTNRQRALTWMHQASLRPTSPYDTSVYTNEPPSSTPYLIRNRTQALHNLNISIQETNPASSPFHGTESSLSLLDLLPLIMKLTASFAHDHNTNIRSNEQLENLLSEYMLQACLEQYLVRGSRDPLIIDEAFSWGHISPSSSNSTALNSSDPPPAGQRQQTSTKEEGGDPEPDYMNLFFEHDDGGEVPGWFETKKKFLDMLLPIRRGRDRSSTPASTGGPIAESMDFEINLIRTLESAARRYPATAFEKMMLEYLDALAKAGETPVLMQLERGTLFDMDEKKTKEFLTDVCGLGDSAGDIGWKEFSRQCQFD